MFHSHSIGRWVLTLALLVASPIAAHVGCAGAAKTFDEVNNPQDDVTLRKCHLEMIHAHPEAGPESTETEQRAAYHTYTECLHDGGIR